MGHYRTGGSGREPLNLAHRSTAEPCERAAHDVSTIRLGDDRHAELEQARHRVVRDKAFGSGRASSMSAHCQLAVTTGDGMVCQADCDQRRPDPARNEGCVVLRLWSSETSLRLPRPAQDVRHLIDHGVRQHRGALTSPARRAISRVRSDGPAPVLRQ